MNSYSLRFLFILTTAAATLAAALGALLAIDLQQLGIGWFVGASLGSGMVGAIVGLLVGMHDYRRVSGVGIGMTVGFIVGLVISPLLFLDSSVASRVLMAQVAGALVLVMLGISARISQV